MHKAQERLYKKKEREKKRKRKQIYATIQTRQ